MRLNTRHQGDKSLYIITALVLAPLAFQRPQGLVGWMQYAISVLFQGAALPVLGYVARRAGENQERVLNETHATVIEELALIKEELALARECHGLRYPNCFLR